MYFSLHSTDKTVKYELFILLRNLQVYSRKQTYETFFKVNLLTSAVLGNTRGTSRKLRDVTTKHFDGMKINKVNEPERLAFTGRTLKGSWRRLPTAFTSSLSL